MATPVDTSSFNPQQLAAFNSANALGTGVQTTNTSSQTPASYVNPNASLQVPISSASNTVPPAITTGSPQQTGANAQNMAQQGQLTDTSTQQPPVQSSSAPPAGNLQPGAQGADVQQLQNYLVQMGYLTPDQVSTGAGIYGPQTTAAVAKLQNDLGIQAGNGQGYYGPQTQSALSQKYQSIFDQLKGSQVPDNGGTARAAIEGADIASTSANDPVLGAMAGSLAPIMQSLTQVLNNINNPALGAVSLQQEYNDLASQNGLPAMQAQLMNMQNIMNGTEDDIRDEVTKAGGFTTDSQVQGLTAARNKVIQKQYNSLATQYQSAQTTIQNMLQYAEADQSNALQRASLTANVTQTMASIQNQMFNMATTMQENATSNVNNIVSKVGYDGLAASTQGNTTLQNSYEKLLGLAPGSLSNPAFLDAAKDKSFQIVGTADTGYYKVDKDGNTSPLGIGGSTPGNTTSTNSAYAPILKTILGSGKFTKQQEATISDAINNGEDPFTVIKNQAKNIMNNTESTKLSAYEAADNAMKDLQNSLQDYYANGGDTSLLSGTMEQTYNKLGEVKDPKKVQLATQVAVSLQAYRNAISGTAYSNQEGQQISAIFPGINKSNGLNNAIIQGRLTADASLIDGIYRTTLGPAYDQLKTLNSQDNTTGQIPMVNPDGTQGTIPASQVKEALASGYHFADGPMDRI